MTVWNKKPEAPEQLNKPSRAIARARRRIAVQAWITVLSISVIAVLIFGMTAAWYSNIVTTKDLTVKASSWAFGEDSILIDLNEKALRPGGEVLIPFSLKNDSEADTYRLRVDVKWPEDSARMQQRLYFYTEDEDRNRSYLNALNGAIYGPVSPGDTLEVKNLHAAWVYDTLGYFVLCSYDAAAGAAQIESYLQPISYDLDSAAFDTNGVLVSAKVAGTELELSGLLDYYYGEFLPEASYSNFEESGSPAPSIDDGNGTFYFVKQQGEKAICLYLCNKTAIEANTQYDTEQANQEQELTVSLVFTGESIPAPTAASPEPTEEPAPEPTEEPEGGA